MRKIFSLKTMERVYDFLKTRRMSMLLFPVSVKKDLIVLNRQERSYYAKKIMQAIGGLLVVSILAIYVTIKGVFLDATPINSVARPKPGEVSTEVALQIESQKGEAMYKLEISPRVLSYDEADEMFYEMVDFLETYILNQNSSAMQITRDLSLPDNLEGYPFDIYWESDKEHLIDNIGNVHRENLEADEVVTLTAICSYMEYQWEYSFAVCVMKEMLSEQELYRRNLESYLKQEEIRQQGADIWELPTAFQGGKLQYRIVQKSGKYFALVVVLLVCVLALWVGADRDLQIQSLKRRDQFEEEYLGFVTGLSLYITAGVTLQAAMKCSVKDYTAKKPATNVLRAVLLDFEKDIANGYSFQGALERFAKATDHNYYRQLAGLLQQGLLNGSNDLARILEVEVDKMREAKRRMSRVKGEKISTALIAPMMLQLCVVIALIMFPAFSNMQF